MVTESQVEQFDVVVMTHGNMDLSIRCVKAIFSHTQTPFHLIVVDDSTPDMDGGTDMTPEWFERFCKSHPNVTYVHSDIPFKNGFEILREGFKRCKTPYMALATNSMIVEPDWELAALQVMKTSPTIGAIGLKCLRYGTELIESAGLAVTANGATISDIGRGQAAHRFSKAYECDVVQWALVLLRVKAVEPNLGAEVYHGFKGCEEFETCYTMREQGWKIFFCGVGVGYHQTLATRIAKDANDLVLNAQNKEIFYKRWGFWDKYHQTNPGIPEFFPDMPKREKMLPPVMLIDPTGIIKQRVEKFNQRDIERTYETTQDLG